MKEGRIMRDKICQPDYPSSKQNVGGRARRTYGRSRKSIGAVLKKKKCTPSLKILRT